MTWCCHCCEPGPSPCSRCKAMLAEQGDWEPPLPPPRGAWIRGRYEATAQEIQAYSELSARRSFEPFDQVRPKVKPGHATNRWGQAVTAWKKDPGKIK